MDKNAIQKYAIWARNELIGQVKQRAFQYGISNKGYGEENASVINGRVLTPDEKRQRQDFVHEIQKNGFEQAVEEVAYTWFNRFVALRFMEVNDYLPTHVRVFSDASGGFNPEILKDVLHLDLEGLDKAKVSTLLNANQIQELYRYLLLTQCNALNIALPEMFEKLGSYTEMLLPNNILKQDSVLARLVKDIDDDNFNVLKTGQVEIIGWMYQYYNTEPKQAVFDGLKKNIKITKEKIPAATQLFTPDWIVRYMVENSLGRLWLEHCRAESGLTDEYMNASYYDWRYYIEEAEQTPEVAAQLEALRFEYKDLKPEEIKVIDPCMGSGHILVYAFDVLMKIYTSQAYSERDAVKLILEKNLYGLDIDRRAYQLAYFSLMMKARQYNRRLFTDGTKPQVYHPAGFPDGEEYGSLVKVDTLPLKPVEATGQLRLEDTAYETALTAWNFKRLLAQKYDVVVTNPPYMGSSGMGAKLSEFVKDNYSDSKSDLFSAFIERGLEMIKPSGYNCMVTMQSWMFLSSFETIRKKILSTRTITNLLHMENMVMGIAFGTAVANLYGQHITDYMGQYNYITMKDIEDEKPTVFPTAHKRNCIANIENFKKIPGSPVAYWVSKAIASSFGQDSIFAHTISDGQNKTGDNDKYLRFFWEIRNLEVGESRKYRFYAKGGNYRKWYGNLEYVIDWSEKARSFYRKDKIARLIPEYLWYKEGITWTLLSSSNTAFRELPTYATFDVTGSSLFLKNTNELPWILAVLNSRVGEYMLSILSSTIAYQITEVRRVPLPSSLLERSNQIACYSKQCLDVSKTDWDSFETSWDFKHHPLLCGEKTVVVALGKWESEATKRFDTLKANEEELNRIFIEIYGLQNELTPEVAEKNVTVRRADLGREIRSLISYAVGCMFGRYSLDCDGLAYAGGDWDASKYSTFIPDKDNILPICDDEYFEDDIVGRFVDFIRVAYGAETLEENLKFIADALGGKGTPREVIRSYFLNDFYADHCKIYQKRPIYWLFDSGKKNGFKALVYLHRYSRDLLAKMRTDYVHEQQERYRTQLSHIAAALNTATGAERAKLLKQQDKLAEQLKEITVFEEKVHHLADQNINIDLDDGVKKNYAIFADVLAKI